MFPAQWAAKLYDHVISVEPNYAEAARTVFFITWINKVSCSMEMNMEEALGPVSAAALEV